MLGFRTSWRGMLFSAAALLATTSQAQVYQPPTYTPGQQYPAPQYPLYQQYPVNAPPVVPAAPQPQITLSPAQIDQLVAPVALYPDPLLAQLFPAATFPQDVVTAEQWITTNPNVTEDDIQAQPWDPSVKAMLNYPAVLQTMAQSIDWTQALGAAFVNQQQDVLDSVQRLRAQAIAAGTLKSTPQMQVINDNGAWRIEPVDPNLVSVPVYDPNLVYTQPGEIVYGPPMPIGFWLDNDFDWHHHWLNVGVNWYSGWHHPEEWDRHPPAWERLRQERDRDDRRREGNDHQIHAPALPPKHWTRAPDRSAPRLTPDLINRANADRGHGMPQNHTGNVPHLPPPLPVGPRTTPGAAEPRNVFGAQQNRNDVQRADDRAHESHTPVPAPRELPHETPRAIPAHPAEPHAVAPLAPTPRVIETPRHIAPAPRPPEPPHPVPAIPAQHAPEPPRSSAPAAPPHIAVPAPAFPSGGSASDTREQSQRGHDSTHH